MDFVSLYKKVHYGHLLRPGYVIVLDVPEIYKKVYLFIYKSLTYYFSGPQSMKSSPMNRTQSSAFNHEAENEHPVGNTGWERCGLAGAPAVHPSLDAGHAEDTCCPLLLLMEMHHQHSYIGTDHADLTSLLSLRSHSRAILRVSSIVSSRLVSVSRGSHELTAYLDGDSRSEDVEQSTGWIACCSGSVSTWWQSRGPWWPGARDRMLVRVFMRQNCATFQILSQLTLVRNICEQNSAVTGTQYVLT